jgi:opacity protein-like surface antigen
MKRFSMLVVTAFALWSAGLFAQAPTPYHTAAQAQAPARAKTWSGTLVDANCKQSTPDQACRVTGTTTAYGLESGGKFLRFDETGNLMAIKEMEKVGAKSGKITARVTGVMEGDTIRVQSVQLH